MYKMANFPITFGDFFLRVVLLMHDYGAITEICEKMHLRELLSLQNESHS